MPNHVKTIKQKDINNWNKVKDIEDVKVQITEDTPFANIGQSQKDFNKNASDYKINSDLKNQEQDDRLTDIESENAAQHDLIDDLQTTLNNKINKGSLTSNDDSLLVEGENIEVQLSIYSEEFEQKIFNLTFTPINILGIYQNGIYLRTYEFILNLPKSITINNYNTNDIIIVQYQHLKTDI